MVQKDYFVFETIRDQNKQVICHYLTVIGTIKEDGLVRLCMDLRKDGDDKTVFCATPSVTKTVRFNC